MEMERERAERRAWDKERRGRVERWKDAAHGQGEGEGDGKKKEDRKAGERAAWKERKKKRREEKV